MIEIDVCVRVPVSWMTVFKFLPIVGRPNNWEMILYKDTTLSNFPMQGSLVLHPAVNCR